MRLYLALPSLFLLFGGAALAADVASANINDYDSASLYPKRVRSMQFTHVLDATHGVTWDNWTVLFGKELPTAVWRAGDGYTTVTIGNLLCGNSAGDAHLCAFEIQYYNRAGGPPSCSVSDVDGSYVIDLEGLNCPDSIAFSQ